MKKINLITIGLIGALTFSGCSVLNQNSTSGVNEATGQKFTVDNSLPIWVSNAQSGLESGIAAVGQAGYSKYGDEVMMPIAQLSAKNNLAGVIQEKIFAFQKRVAKRSQIDIDESYASIFKSASKRIVKGMNLSGVQSISRFQSPVTGTLYLRVVLPTKKVLDEMRDTQEELKKKYKEMGLTAQAAQEMVKGVEEEAEKEWN